MSEFVSQPIPASPGAPVPLPLIIVTFGDSHIAVPRSECKEFCPRPNTLFTGLFWSIRDAFPPLKDTPDASIAIAARVPGMQSAVQIMPSLWPHIWSTVTEVVVHIPPTEDDKRFKLVTEVATSQIHLHAPDGQIFELRINLNVANLQDLKRLIERKVGVAVERQIVVFKNRVYGAHGMKEAGTEVAGDDVLINCDVKLSHTLALRLKSKENIGDVRDWPTSKEKIG